MTRTTVLALLLLLVLPASALADRTQVYSIQGADCGDCGREVQVELKKVKGVKKASFDIHKVELTLTLSDKVTDQQVLAAIERAGLQGFVGAGKGAYLPHEAYPDGADMVIVTSNGSAVGPLEKLRVADKFTVLDFYADWCGPCRTVDARLRELIASRPDLAVRKLNVVDFKSALAKEQGSRLKALPHVVVFAPDGKRTEITGADTKKLDAALAAD